MTTARGGLKTCTESPMSTEVWEDYVKLGDLKRPPVSILDVLGPAGADIERS